MTRDRQPAAAIRASSKTDFQEFLRLARSSTGDPAWFAIPVDAEEDDESYTVVFHVAGRDERDLSVEGNGHSLIVWGASRGDQKREMRVCALGGTIKSTSIELTRSGELLSVRVLKERSDREPRDASAR